MTALAPVVELRLFRALSVEARDEILAAASRVRCRRGQRLFRQGAPAGLFYVLGEGRIKLTQLTADGHLVLLRFVFAGEAFGAVAALGERNYPVSADAADDCVAWSWTGRSMDRLLRRHAQLAMNLIDLMAERLHVMQGRFQELATQQVEQRLARTLLRLVDRAGRRVDGGVLIDMRLSRQELAEMSGTTLYTASRILKRWQTDGIVRTRQQKILVCYPHGLVVVAEDLPTLGS